MNKDNLGYVYAALAILFWSTVATAIKLGLKEINFVQLLLYSSFFSALALFVILIIQNKLSLLKECTKRDILSSMGLGFLNPFLYYVVLFKAYSLLLAQQAQILNNVWPIMLVLLSVPLLKQKLSLKSFIAILISFFGVIIIGTQGNIATLAFSNPVGVLLALGSSVVWATFWIYNRKDKRDAVVKLFLNFVFGFILVLIYALFTSNIIIPALGVILITAYIGLFEMGLTFVLWLNALKLKESAKIAHFIYIGPVLSLIFIHFILGETILISSIAGLVFIIGGVLLNSLGKKD